MSAAVSAATGLRVAGWGTALPDGVVTNGDLARRLDTSDEWITARTGIRQRHWGGTTAGLASAAAAEALGRAGPSPDIDLTMVATCSPDVALPATAVAVSHELGLTGAAVDINAACCGFVHGLVTAAALLAGPLERVLLVGSETLSRLTDPTDRSTAVLFADGAGAVVLERADGAGALLASDLGNDAGGRHLICAPVGGPLRMEGRELFRQAVRAVVDSVERTLARAEVAPDEVDLVVPHQANLRILDAAAQRTSIPRDRWTTVLERTGNTSAASVPLALADAMDAGRVADGSLVLLCGFGAGLSWATALVRWDGGGLR